MKVIVIGCTHAGTAAIKNMKKQNPNIEVTVYEKNDNVSFLSCGIALYVGGVIKDKTGLFYSSPKELNAMGVKTNMEHEVLNIDYENKFVEVKNLITNQVSKDSFDKLVIATGSWPIIPRIKGIDSANVLLSKNYNQANEIIEQTKNVKKIAVVGAGYIGVELAEAFEKNGKEVILIDAENRIMPKYLDEEFTIIAEQAFTDHHVQLALNQKVESFVVNNGLVTAIKTDKNTFDVDTVIMCIGFRPNSNLYLNKLGTTPNGALVVNEYMQTSNPDVFACGDCVNSYYNPSHEIKYIPLATNAVRMGTLVGLNIENQHVKYMGTQGTSGIKIYDWNISSTGITEGVAKQMNIDYQSVTIKDHNRPEFMPTYEDVILKIVFDKSTRKVIGGQIISKADMTEKMNTLSVVIQNEMTIEQLAFQDFFFQPNYSKTWNLLNLAGLEGIALK
ncbi:MAG: FAD-dependent oxidoreductase [Acholeplasmataceae bacterium]